MDTDTIREKYIRSEEALNRLKDDISQLIFTRVQDLKTTQEYLETLIKEKEAVEGNPMMPFPGMAPPKREKTDLEKSMEKPYILLACGRIGKRMKI